MTTEAKKTPPAGAAGGAMTSRRSHLNGNREASGPALPREAEEFLAELDMFGAPMFALRRAEQRSDDLIKGWFTAPRGYTSFDAEGNAARLAVARPGDALAMVCGVVFDVIDYDPRNDHEGQALTALRRQGLIPHPSYVVETPGGGWHMYIPATGLPSGQLMVAVDFKARGGFVLTPGTEGYRLLSQDEWPDLGEFPDDAVARMAASMARRPSPDSGAVDADLSTPPSEQELLMAQGALNKSERVIRDSVAGTRNITLFGEAVWLANFAAGGCLEWADVEATLTDAARDAGLTAPEIAATLASARERGEQDPRRPRALTGFEVLPVDEQRELLDTIFEATPVLRHVRQAAHSRSTSAASVLGALLAKVMSRVPVHHVLPPIVGSHASLNFAVALVADSGIGKSTSLGIADELLEDRVEPQVSGAGPGSGEGLVQAFLENYKDPTTKLTYPVLKAYPHVLLTVDEIGRLGKVQERNGSSMASVLREALTGGALTTSNADRNRNRVVPKMSYRFTAIAGVQPALSSILLNDEDAGTPQRWLWLPAWDRCLPDEADQPAWPGPLDWQPDLTASFDRHVLAVPDVVARGLRARHVKVVRRELKPGLNSHAGLAQLKIAAALAYLHGEGDITMRWWGLAEALLKLSDGVRADCVAALRDQSEQEMKRAGRRDAIRAQAASDSHAEDIKKRATSVRKRARDHAGKQEHPEPGCTRSCFTNILQRYSKDVVDRAIEEAESQGWIETKGDRWLPGPNASDDQERELTQ